LDYSQHSDQTLLRLIAHSQDSALEELYDRFSRLVFSLAVNSVGDSALAEEITQDVFLRIWEKADTYQVDKGEVKTWIASIARNRSIDVIRRRNIRPEGRLSPWDDMLEKNLSAEVDVEEEVDHMNRRNLVREAIIQLPDEQRKALSYAYFQGFSHREIAQILDEPVGTIKTRIRLAMQKLRQTLQEEESSA
jgi:RNA polymerase sigma-70 factor (ECF subfamily)